MSSFHTNPAAQEANAWLVDLFFTNGGNRAFHAHAAAYLKLSKLLPGIDALTSAMVKYGRTHDTKATLRKFMMVYHPDKNDDMEATKYMQILNLLKEIVKESKIPTFRLLFYCLYMYGMWRRAGFCSLSRLYDKRDEEGERVRAAWSEAAKEAAAKEAAAKEAADKEAAAKDRGSISAGMR